MTNKHNNPVSYINFDSFGAIQSGRIITSVGDWFAIVNARNRYGYHNLVAIDLDSGQAFRHGNYAVVQFLYGYKFDKQLSRVASFFSKRGRTLPLDPPDYSNYPKPKYPPRRVRKLSDY